ncbi:uncharacterized protein LOC125896252 [Epinephelus fuscoguttatus]|uniref:uncharacterized protein LOC125896252 n=1 Tax=Epinephelus fuscoguttatus TaxID=293821 RepID=UPI0020D0A3A9|nr:uncharacterized protein LOC125896252 [Epinephelus fuscoguttatus]
MDMMECAGDGECWYLLWHTGDNTLCQWCAVTSRGVALKLFDAPFPPPDTFPPKLGICCLLKVLSGAFLPSSTSTSTTTSTPSSLHRRAATEAAATSLTTSIKCCQNRCRVQLKRETRHSNRTMDTSSQWSTHKRNLWSADRSPVTQKHTHSPSAGLRLNLQDSRSEETHTTSRSEGQRSQSGSEWGLHHSRITAGRGGGGGSGGGKEKQSGWKDGRREG